MVTFYDHYMHNLTELLNIIRRSQYIVQYIILFNIILFIVKEKEFVLWCKYIYCDEFNNILTIYGKPAEPINGRYYIKSKYHPIVDDSAEEYCDTIICIELN